MNARNAALPALARVFARARKASFVLLEIRRDGPNRIVCEDASALCESDGRREVLRAMVIALRDMVHEAELLLAAEIERDAKCN